MVGYYSFVAFFFEDSIFTPDKLPGVKKKIVGECICGPNQCNGERETEKGNTRKYKLGKAKNASGHWKKKKKYTYMLIK